VILVLHQCHLCYTDSCNTMEHQQAIIILQNMIDSYSLDGDEKEAVVTAVGMLSWGVLGKNRMKALRNKRNKNIKLP